MEITSFARGYLARVGANVQGVGIRQGSDVLAPVIDIDNLLGLGFRKTLNFGNTNLTAFQFVTNGGSVPVGKVWRLLALSGWVTTAAGETVSGYQLGIRMAENGAANNAFVGLTPPVDAPVSRSIAAGVWEGDLLLRSGDQLGAFCTENAGGAADWTLNAVVEEFQG